MRKITVRIFLIFFVLGFAYPVQSSSLTTVLQKLEETYHAIDDFEADFDQIETNVLLNRIKKTSGTIYSLPQRKIFWHTKTPTLFKVISDGNDIWLYYPNENQLFTEKWGKLDSNTKLALLFLRREGNLEKYFNIRWKNEKQLELELIPKKSLSVQKIYLTLTQDKRVFLKKIIFFFPMERKTELTLKNIKFNQKLLERHKQQPLDQNINDKFQFILPKK
ncbi:MAG: hypothetical protein A2Z91_03385 [Deltaproteobacteria bacterium GWA2_38_16]|nr:MAG: hypothetical protein A2Z91_03385 [Deltaproteobacteria bacterium GWA2_38_16]OGQ02273.1 MAG: hypothetical protein A3D19_05560 [Deltaproteobacteria bacterium RIFCSPHIGHO2_02_FULL_38_15]OGQ33969.1 MAG: hypothetical protein A3A72_09125 [Deltaproteobacteria bacterium RIFCSPLOWO2_01_FULL_38_9]OGQ63083.1 MAG: hypothetical protein A3G92_07995 [Deltaproteobacteria bacterium RIFCSPLOWO2_12_FULL_38_8]